MNKKIWAYAKGNDGEYVVGENHPLKIFYIWEALKLKKNIHGFNELTFMSTHKDPGKRVELSAVKTGFYRYKKRNVSSEESDGDSNSLSHSIAIQVLAEMDEINFKLSGGHEFQLKVKSIRSDDLKIQLTNKNKFSYYYPDLICAFEEPDGLAMKWGGKLAIEVKHTHACEREKITDFESHGIPIIEVNIGNISIEEKFSTKNPTPDILEKYYNYLKSIFSKQVYGKILSNPVSVDFFDLVISDKDEEINCLKSKVAEISESLDLLLENTNSLKSKLSLSVERCEELTKSNSSLLEQCEGYRLKLKERDRKIAEIEMRGFGFFISKLFGFK